MDNRQPELKNALFREIAELNEKIHYFQWLLYRLSRAFPRVSLPDLRKVIDSHEQKVPLLTTYEWVSWTFHRAERKEAELRAKKVPSAVVGCTNSHPDMANIMLKECENGRWGLSAEIKLLKRGRIIYASPRGSPAAPCPRLERDWSALEVEIQKRPDLHHESSKGQVVELLDDAVTVAAPAALPDVPASVVDDSIVCGCCYGEFSFEELLQCADGHLFCVDCLRRHFENYVFGTSSSQETCGLPPCMDTDGCDKTFPWSEVKRAVPEDALTKYEQRQAEVSVAKAKLEGLVYCPSCSHPWEVDPLMHTLVCENQNCRKLSCIKCKKPAHHPLGCHEIKNPSDTALRTRVEELMSKALIRECLSCRAELVKQDGCNKIVCRCGKIMCYVCRKAISNYSHFCTHTREPGKSCTQCSSCSLWQREDEVQVVEKAKQVAMEEVISNHPTFIKRDIGPSAVTPAIPAKRVRV